MPSDTRTFNSAGLTGFQLGNNVGDALGIPRTEPEFSVVPISGAIGGRTIARLIFHRNPNGVSAVDANGQWIINRVNANLPAFSFEIGTRGRSIRMPSLGATAVNPGELYVTSINGVRVVAIR